MFISHKYRVTKIDVSLVKATNSKHSFVLASFKLLFNKTMLSMRIAIRTISIIFMIEKKNKFTYYFFFFKISFLLCLKSELNHFIYCVKCLLIIHFKNSFFLFCFLLTCYLVLCFGEYTYD